MSGTKNGGLRSIITQRELSLRISSKVPLVYLVSHMPKGRIVCEVGTEEQFGPHMRRMVIYAMHPETWHRANDEAYMLFGEQSEMPWVVNRAPDLFGHAVSTFLRFPRLPLIQESPADADDGFVEWRTEL